MSQLQRILYVEAEADIRTVAQLALGTLGGFTVKLCASGEEAIEEVSPGVSAAAGGDTRPLRQLSQRRRVGERRSRMMSHQPMPLRLLIGALILTITVAGLLPAQDSEDFAVQYATARTIDELRAGGFVIYMRHGPTDSSVPDRYPVDTDDCTTQRPLTEEGRRVSAAVGQAIRSAGIPTGEVLVSPMCRTRETARLAFGENYIPEELLGYTAHLTSREREPRAAFLRRIFSDPVAAGTNRVVVAHAPNIFDVLGYFPEQEGIVVVIRPRGEHGFEYVASIFPSHWRDLVD